MQFVPGERLTQDLPGLGADPGERRVGLREPGAVAVRVDASSTSSRSSSSRARADDGTYTFQPSLPSAVAQEHSTPRRWVPQGFGLPWLDPYGGPVGRDGAPRLRLVVVTDDDPGPLLCRGCGGLLMPTVKAAVVFCSSACRARHWRRMRRARARTEAVQADRTANCPECGESWTVGAEHPASARYCSPRCRKRAWHRQRTAQSGV